MKAPLDLAQKAPGARWSLTTAGEISPLFMSRGFWLGVVVPVVFLGILYSESLAYMVHIWSTDENYGHGFFVPIISLGLIWQKRDRLRGTGTHGSWWGVPVVLAGAGLFVVGELATLYVALHFSLWLILAGLLLSAVGPRGVREIIFPIGFLLTMIPLPHFLYQSLSGQLQLISSTVGVGCLQLVGITAFQEGNVIDLGPIQLQVVEACSGLRYLFPLASLALLCAYLFKDRMWKRVVLFLSSIPISIGLNGFRIGMIGVLVEFYGQGAAEGFYHLFEGWLLFVASLGLLGVEMWLLARIGRHHRSRAFPDLFGRPGGEAIVRPEIFPGPVGGGPTRVVSAYTVSVILLVPMFLASTQLTTRAEIPPARQSFMDFPMRVGTWGGTPIILEKKYVDALKFDDYILADFRTSGGPPVNFYVAYYQSQKKGESAHSPRTCMPGGGWEITSLEDREVEGPSQGEPMIVNRAVIQKGAQKQLVYYWFQQRGRIVTNEYLVKFYLFWDAMAKQRTDGALVRLTALVGPGEAESTVENRLVEFTKAVRPRLARYIPD